MRRFVLVSADDLRVLPGRERVICSMAALAFTNVSARPGDPPAQRLRTRTWGDEVGDWRVYLVQRSAPTLDGSGTRPRCGMGALRTRHECRASWPRKTTAVHMEQRCGNVPNEKGQVGQQPFAMCPFRARH